MKYPMENKPKKQLYLFYFYENNTSCKDGSYIAASNRPINLYQFIS